MSSCFRHFALQFLYRLYDDLRSTYRPFESLFLKGMTTIRKPAFNCGEQCNLLLPLPLHAPLLVCCSYFGFDELCHFAELS